MKKPTIQEMRKVKMKNKGALAISQILILIISIFAFCFILNLGSVSADPQGTETNAGETTGVAAGAAAAVNPTKAPSFYENILGFDEASTTKGLTETQQGKMIFAQGNFIDGVVSSASWGIIAYSVVKLAGSLFGLDDNKVNAASMALGFGVAAGRAAQLLATKNEAVKNLVTNKLNIDAATFGIGVGIITTAIIFYLSYKDTETEVVSFTCYAWDAPTGGNNCEKCNDGSLPCSEYQCRSLGQACELINSEDEEPKCVWVSKDDVEPPVISAWESALLDGYSYSPDDAISPPDRGVYILNDDADEGCAAAFTPLSFGVTLDEPGRCKIDYSNADSFEDMEFYFGGSSLFKYNHTQVMSLPGADAEENGSLILDNGGDFELYVRCEDANGNYNTANFVFKFCVEDGPDTTAPLMVSTNVLNDMPVAYGQTELDLELYVNEPAECRWSHLDEDYDEMDEEFDCSTSVFEMNAQMLYECDTTLTGLNDNTENEFYFRCKDQPTADEADRNTNSESYVFTVIGTQPLAITDVAPNGTISDSTDSIKITLEAETSAGYDDGVSTCYYSDSGDDDDYIMFYETDSYEHSQDLWLSEGDYEYFIKCIDLGGNSDVENVSFIVETDTSSPIVVRAYHDSDYLKLITSEDAECVYDTVDCNYGFDDGIGMTSDETEHFTDWNTNIDYYIKCRDEYGNEPGPDECSIIARPSEI